MLTPKYASLAQIEIVSKGLGNPFEPRRETGTPEMVSVRMDKEAIGTHVRALQSSDLALKVAAELHLAEKPEFNSALAKRGVFGAFLQASASSDRVPARPTKTACWSLLRCAAHLPDQGYARHHDRIQVRAIRGWPPRSPTRWPSFIATIFPLRAVLETKDARAKLGPQIVKLAEEVAEAEAQVTRFRGAVQHLRWRA